MKTYRYKLLIKFDEPIRFEDLPHLIAQVMYPDEGSMFYGVARLNLEAELESAVQSGEITVRNPVSLGSSILLVGSALNTSVVFPEDILDYLGNRGIQLINQSDIGSSSLHKTKHHWGEIELRQLLAMSLKPGMTHQKLAEHYGLKRQSISKTLRKAKDLDKPRRASPFGPVIRSK